MEKDIIGFWVGIISLVLAIPLGIASNLLTTRLLSYLERRRLIKARKTRQQALQVYKRIRAFQEGRRDKYPFYILLASSAVLCAIASSTILVGVLLISPSVESTGASDLAGGDRTAWLRMQSEAKRSRGRFSLQFAICREIFRNCRES